ncbi:hypothetical protein [Varibaculum vaginae]|uniref:hypothetical protein n=1 Tax=Varibaculum vaginae TaxID=2364797 RepID=UPI000F08A5B9|nr:hypothetical protein [Varibaculum vaginae]
METKSALTTVKDHRGYHENKIEELVGENWVAVPVNAELLPVLQLIVPSGKTFFPCPHLIKDERGKNWLVRPNMRGNETVSKNIKKSLLAARRARAEFSNGGQENINSPKKSLVESLNKFDNTVLARNAIQLAPSGVNQIFLADAEKNKDIDRPLRAAGKPKNPEINLPVRKRTPSFSVPKLTPPVSIFAPQYEQEKPGSVSSAKVGYSPPNQSSESLVDPAADTAETSLAEPAWKRLKAKVVKKETGDFSGVAETADIEIFAAPPAAWKLWVRRLLPAISIALLAAGSWQLAAGL